MKSPSSLSLLALAVSLFVTSCTTGVTPCGPDTYMVSSQAGGFSDGPSRARAYRAANEFCEKRGLVMVPVSMDANRGELGRRPPMAHLVFRALKPGDPDIKRPNIEGPDITIRVQDR